MPKRKQTKEILIHVMSGIEATRAAMPHYNGFYNGCGPHKNKKKYNRKDKTWKKELME